MTLNRAWMAWKSSDGRLDVRGKIAGILGGPARIEFDRRVGRQVAGIFF